MHKILFTLVWMGAALTASAQDGAWPEELNACKAGIRPELKDPDSLRFIEVTGNRGLTDDELQGARWIRYKATNSFGGFIARSALCHPEKGRMTNKETNCVITVALAVPIDLEAMHMQPRYNETRDAYIRRGTAAHNERSARMASVQVFGGAGPIASCTPPTR